VPGAATSPPASVAGVDFGQLDDAGYSAIDWGEVSFTGLKKTNLQALDWGKVEWNEIDWSLGSPPGLRWKNVDWAEFSWDDTVRTGGIDWGEVDWKQVSANPRDSDYAQIDWSRVQWEELDWGAGKKTDAFLIDWGEVNWGWVGLSDPAVLAGIQWGFVQVRELDADDIALIVQITGSTPAQLAAAQAAT
jgi:hypothetical protein